MDAAHVAQLPREMQGRLLELYAIESAPDVREFVTTDGALVAALEGAAHRPATEKLLVLEEPEELSVSLYLDPHMLARLADSGLDQVTQRSVADFWDLAEGVSHFTLLTWSAACERPVSALELELQAEVDKFVLAVQATRADLPNHALLPLQHLQFERANFDPALDGSERERYVTASAYARRYCRNLSALLAGARHVEFRTELRRFYRMSRNDKLHRIAALN